MRLALFHDALVENEPICIGCKELAENPSHSGLLCRSCDDEQTRPASWKEPLQPPSRRAGHALDAQAQILRPGAAEARLAHLDTAFRHACALATALAGLATGCFGSHVVGSAPTDAGPVAPPPVDAGTIPPPPPPPPPPLDAGSVTDPRACSPIGVTSTTCTDCPADGPPFWAWDGSRCVALEVCDRIHIDESLPTYGSYRACLGATRHCDASLCLASDGRWLPELQYCDHHDCSGLPGPYVCESPTPACNCGAQRFFVSGVGCVIPDGLCEAVSPERLCEASGGSLEDCPPGMVCTGLSCTCPRGRRFDPGFGCVPDWNLDCDAGGCVLSASLAGTPCDPLAQACGDGLACCSSGRADRPTCQPACGCYVE